MAGKAGTRTAQIRGHSDAESAYVLRDYYQRMSLVRAFEMLLFVVTVIIAYVYVVRRGGLTWE